MANIGQWKFLKLTPKMKKSPTPNIIKNTITRKSIMTPSTNIITGTGTSSNISIMNPSFTTHHIMKLLMNTITVRETWRNILSQSTNTIKGTRNFIKSWEGI